MLIAQISDFHVTTQGVQAYGRVDTVALLRQAVGAINALPAKPDLVLATGDLVQTGQSAEYELLLEVLADFDAPIVPVVGNHDERAALASAFKLDRRFDVQPGFIQYVVEGYPLRLIVLDSVTEGSADPSYCAARLDWLSAQLDRDVQPTLLAMHHPPFPAGVAWMEPKDPDWAAGLGELIAGRREIQRLVCGHVHRAMSTVWAGTLAMTAPGAAHQVFLDLHTQRRRFSFEAPGFLLHHWLDGLLLSYGGAVPGLADAFDLEASTGRRG